MRPLGMEVGGMKDCATLMASESTLAREKRGCVSAAHMPAAVACGETAPIDPTVGGDTRAPSPAFEPSDPTCFPAPPAEKEGEEGAARLVVLGTLTSVEGARGGLLGLCCCCCCCC